MLLRSLAIAGFAVALAGCSPGTMGPPLHAQDAAPVSSGDPGEGDDSLAARVLAAMALERSTGRTPDPSRLTDIR